MRVFRRSVAPLCPQTSPGPCAHLCEMRRAFNGRRSAVYMYVFRDTSSKHQLITVRSLAFYFEPCASRVFSPPGQTIFHFFLFFRYPLTSSLTRIFRRLKLTSRVGAERVVSQLCVCEDNDIMILKQFFTEVYTYITLLFTFSLATMCDKHLYIFLCAVDVNRQFD